MGSELLQLRDKLGPSGIDRVESDPVCQDVSKANMPTPGKFKGPRRHLAAVKTAQSISKLKKIIDKR